MAKSKDESDGRGRETKATMIGITAMTQNGNECRFERRRRLVKQELASLEGLKTSART